MNHGVWSGTKNKNENEVDIVTKFSFLVGLNDLTLLPAHNSEPLEQWWRKTPQGERKRWREFEKNFSRSQPSLKPKLDGCSRRCEWAGGVLVLGTTLILETGVWTVIPWKTSLKNKKVWKRHKKISDQQTFQPNQLQGGLERVPTWEIKDKRACQVLTEVQLGELSQPPLVNNGNIRNHWNKIQSPEVIPHGKNPDGATDPQDVVGSVGC